MGADGSALAAGTPFFGMAPCGPLYFLKRGYRQLRPWVAAGFKTRVSDEMVGEWLRDLVLSCHR